MRMTTSPPSCSECYEIWEPKSAGTLWATPGLVRDTFTLYLYSSDMVSIHYTWQQRKQACSQVVEGVQVCAMHPLQIWMNPLGICKIWNTSCRSVCQKRSTPYTTPRVASVETPWSVQTLFQKYMFVLGVL